MALAVQGGLESVAACEARDDRLARGHRLLATGICEVGFACESVMPTQPSIISSLNERGSLRLVPRACGVAAFRRTSLIPIGWDQ